jgi:hypothetical protein
MVVGGERVMAVNFANPDDLINALNLPTQESMMEKAMVLADLARAEIIRLAKEKLHTSERDYVANVQPVQVQGKTVQIILTGVFPNMVEQGWAPHDLRDTVLRSAKAHTSKEGYKYMSIPFRVNMPGASGRNGDVLGEAFAKNQSALKGRTLKGWQQETAAKAKALAPSVAAQGRMKWGGRLSEADGGPKLRERHATGLYTGMYRVQKTYDKTSQNTYGTFRTISTNPDSIRSDGGGQNWSHPGIEARGLFDMANQYVARMVPEVMKG